MRYIVAVWLATLVAGCAFSAKNPEVGSCAGCEWRPLNRSHR